ncbi:glycosyltransferase involved in cell wall biosynthesis [Azospirillum agricola]|uniref:glycosyltransferase n=1 Tax=Azospirillum agricola TaxID=1720247 RepID=UPI001AE6A60B|nr:glycosyltransferase [Azospirillum agricola]MBP2230499.1 glycosyltransferase involved in cell wall biosynthesis [Azospirillum agricola]
MSDTVEARIDALVGYLSDRHFDSDKINRFAALCETIRREVDQPTRLALAERLRRDAPTNDTVRLHSVLFLLTGDLYHYERILHYLLLGGDGVDPALLHYSYWCLSRQLFLGSALGDKTASFVACDLYRFYEAMVRLIARRWSLVPPPAAPRGGPIRRVALVTNQFINDQHQPTRDCFDFASRLQDELGLEVAVINSCTLPSRLENLFMPPMIFHLPEDLEGVVAMEMFGRRVKVASFTGRAFSQAKLQGIVEAVDGYDPDLIVSFGGSNIVADLFAEAGARPVLCIPTTSGLTISLAHILLGFDEQDYTASISELYRAPFVRRFRPFTFGYTLPPTRGDMGDPGIGGAPFVFAVVGTRLDQEATPDFLALIDDILDRCPDALVAFVGEARDLPGRLASLRNGDRTRSLGHVTDIRALYRRCHAFLNPARQGGGGGAGYALAEGVPVVGFAWGDVASVAGPAFTVPDRDSYLARAVALFADADAHEAAASAARARFAEVGDRRRCAERLLAYGEEARALLRAGRRN